MSVNYKLGKKPANRELIAQLPQWDDFVSRNQGAWLAWLVQRAHELWQREQDLTRSASVATQRSSPPPVVLPPVPAVYGLSDLPTPWGVLGNDSVGDCVIAGTMHSIMLLTHEGNGENAQFTTQQAIDLYSAWTGYNPNDPSTDQGTDMTVAAQNWQATGVKDLQGVTHKIGAVIALEVGNDLQLAEASYLFGVVGVGVIFPKQWMDAFNAGQSWDAITHVKDSDIEGGHYVPIIGRRPNGNFVCVTWGQLQEITPAGYEQFNDESLVAINQDYLLGNKKTPQGFDIDQLRQFQQRLAAQAASQGSTGVTQ